MFHSKQFTDSQKQICNRPETESVCYLGIKDVSFSDIFEWPETQLWLEECALENTVSFNKTNISLVHHVIICLCNDFPTIQGLFISNMSVVIADPYNSPIPCQAAGLLLKNCLTVKDVTLKKECQQRWSKLEEETRMACA